MRPPASACGSYLTRRWSESSTHIRLHMKIQNEHSTNLPISSKAIACDPDFHGDQSVYALFISHRPESTRGALHV